MKQELVQSIIDLVNDMISGVHTAMPGTITSFDPATCTATVLPALSIRKPDGTSLAYPAISGVPVVFPQGAGNNFSVSFPVKAGDGCLLVISEQSLDRWMYQRETASDLRHDLTSAIAIPGLFASGGAGVQKACSENAVVIMAGASSIAVKTDQIEIKGNLRVDGNITATGSIG